MKKFKKLLGAAICLALIMCSLSACGSGDSGSEKGGAVSLKFGCTEPKDGVSYPAMMEAFKEKVEELSGGEITVENYYDGTLGEERDLIEGCQMGSVDLCGTGSAPVANFVPNIDLFTLPFLFEDVDHKQAVLKSDIPDRLLNEQYEEAGLKLLGFCEAGFYQMTNGKHEIVTPDDCKNIKFRSLENESMVEVYDTLGFNTVVMPFSEVVTALQNGTIDGFGGTVNNNVTFRSYEMVDYLSITNTMAVVCPVTMSLERWNSLSEEQQGWVTEAMDYGIEVQTSNFSDQYDQELELLKGKMKVTELTESQRDEFKTKLQKVIDKQSAKFDQDMIKEIADMNK